MCGIAGFLQPGALNAAAAAIAGQMAGAIAHRGPDDCGRWIDAESGIALGHRRLAVIDLTAAGHQPMLSASGRFVIVYNGEIYNYRDIRSDLEAGGKGPRWRGDSDTEVLVEAIDRWGVRGALERLNGMFAFAVWDRSSRTLSLARDRMGEKPLYYGLANGVFLFGSELKALHAHPAFRPVLDRDSLSSMLRYDYVPAPHTIWQGIAKLKPAHFVEIAEDGRAVGEPQPYWNLRQVAIEGTTQRLPDGPELVSDLHSRLGDAVAMRMIADVPLGAFLSGGIDSSLIVALMQAQSSRPARTFTIGFEETKFDEAPHAKAIAAHLGTDHTELYVTARDALDVIPRIPRIWDEPFGDSSEIPTYLVSEMSRRDVTVALSGDGGDELFGGYARHRSTPRNWNALSSSPRWFRGNAALALSAVAGPSPVPGTLGRTAAILGSRNFEDLYQWKMSRAHRPDLLVVGGNERWLAAAGPVPFLPEPADKMLYRDLLHHLPDDILTKVDRASMAVSLETRAPFLDHHLVEFAWRLPIAAKLNPKEGKLILRALLRRYLPDAMIDRPKMGFSVPVEEWLRGPLRQWAEELLSAERLKRDAVLEVAPVRKLWMDFVAGKLRHDRVLWSLLMFQEWFVTAR